MDDLELNIPGLVYVRSMSYGLPGYENYTNALVQGTRPSYLWNIVFIYVHPTLRGQGLATKILKAICAAADSQNIKLTLQIKKMDEDGLDEDQLCAWYNRHSFAAADESDPSSDWVRQPRGGRHE